MDSLDTMRAFVAVAETGSFTAAGRMLGQSTNLVSKQVARLEARLGARLLNRTTRSVTLTDIGGDYLARCKPLLEGFEELETVVQDRQTSLRGTIRLTAPASFGSTALMDALALFQEAHPAVTLNLRLSDRRLALVEEGIDLAVRIGTLRDSSLIARRLAPMPLILCAAPQYLAARGRPSTPQDLTAHDCILNIEQADRVVWTFERAGERIDVRVAGRMTVNAPAAAARAAERGLGVARCPAYVIADALAQGRLERVLADYAAPELGVYALYPPTSHLPARVRALLDHLAEHFAGVRFVAAAG